VGGGVCSVISGLARRIVKRRGRIVLIYSDGDGNRGGEVIAWRIVENIYGRCRVAVAWWGVAATFTALRRMARSAYQSSARASRGGTFTRAHCTATSHTSVYAAVISYRRHDVRNAIRLSVAISSDVVSWMRRGIHPAQHTSAARVALPRTAHARGWRWFRAHTCTLVEFRNSAGFVLMFIILRSTTDRRHNKALVTASRKQTMTTVKYYMA